MRRFVVPCKCGCGPKDFLKERELARNPGRFYYRCPMKIKSCSFSWADKLLSSKYSRLHHLILPCEGGFNDMYSNTASPRMSALSHRYAGANSDQASSSSRTSQELVPVGVRASKTEIFAVFCCCYSFVCTIFFMLFVFAVFIGRR